MEWIDRLNRAMDYIEGHLEAPDWQDLFAMVDQDLAANGRWFGKMGIGRDWMLGDEACALARVRIFHPLLSYMVNNDRMGTLTWHSPVTSVT